MVRLQGYNTTMIWNVSLNYYSTPYYCHTMTSVSTELERKRKESWKGTAEEASRTRWRKHVHAPN